jgi:thiamine kinase-like enzyme
LLLEHVPHSELQDCVEQGRAIGAGLAEIHARHFSHAGRLSAELTLRDSFGPELEQLEQYGSEQLQRTGLAELAPRLRARLASARAVLAELEQPFVLLHSDFKLSTLHWTQDDRLLVLDWETAYAGPSLLDVGQLLRWSPPEPFVQGFARAYQEHGGQLPTDWQRHAEAFDAINLAGLLGGSEPGSRRAQEVAARLRRTLSERAK